MISVGKQPGFIWSNKIREGWDRDIQKWSAGVAVRHTPGKAQALSGYPSLAWCWFSPGPQTCLCCFLFFLCWVQPQTGKWHSRSWAFFILQCRALQIILLDGTLAVHLLLLCILSVNSGCSWDTLIACCGSWRWHHKQITINAYKPLLQQQIRCF